MEEVIIRSYQEADRDSVREISWDTAFQGKPASVFFQGKELFVDFLTIYFTDYEPESCFVAEVNNHVVGYLIGAKDTDRLNKTFKNKIVSCLIMKVLKNGILLKMKNVTFFLYCIRGLFRQEFKMPDFSKKYPATLHINIREGFRNLGIGSMLIAVYLDYLKKQKVKGVHLATMSEKASVFFKKQGFYLLHSGRRSYFRYILHKDIPIYIFGKEL